MKKLLLFPLSIILFIGCRTDCSKNPESNSNWIPYQIGDVLKFTNTKDTISFTIKDAKQSDVNAFKNQLNCGDVSDAGFVTEINNVVNLEIRGKSFYYGGEVTEYQFDFKKIDGDSNSQSLQDEFNFESTENYSMNVETLHNLQIGNVTYSKVMKVTNYNENAISKIYVADSVGLVKFEDSETNEEWIRIQ